MSFFTFTEGVKYYQEISQTSSWSRKYPMCAPGVIQYEIHDELAMKVLLTRRSFR